MRRGRTSYHALAFAALLLTGLLACAPQAPAPTSAPAPTAAPLPPTVAAATPAPAPTTAAAPTAATGMAAVAPPSRLVNAGQLTYGVAATFPPFEYQRGNDLAGFDIEMGRFLAEQMGLRTNILNINFDGLIPALQGGRVDLINSAMYINPERSTQVDFIPYMKVGESIVVLKGNPKNIRSLDDLSGKTVTVTRGAIEETYANQQNERFRAAGRPEMTIVAYPTGPDSILAVQQGRGDAFFTSSPGAAYIQEQVPDTFEIASTFAADTQIGMAVRRGDAEMKRALEAALDNFVRSGKYLETMRKYNLPQEGSLFP